MPSPCRRLTHPFRLWQLLKTRKAPFQVVDHLPAEPAADVCYVLGSFEGREFERLAARRCAVMGPPLLKTLLTQPGAAAPQRLQYSAALAGVCVHFTPFAGEKELVRGVRPPSSL